MYLSRVEIDIENRSIFRELNHLGAYHNWVEQSFPQEVETKTRSRKLWRVDYIGGKQYLLVVSEKEPNRSKLEKYAVEGSFVCKNYKPFLNSIKKGDVFQFRVILNPIYSVFEKGTQRGTLCPIYSEQKQREFFLNKSSKLGFHIEDDQFSIVEKGEELLRKKGGFKINLTKAVYEGILTVENPELFKDTLCNGIGREKAYGFGMMTVIRK